MKKKIFLYFFRPYVADSGEMNFGYANRRVSSIDEGNIYRGKQIQEIQL